MCTSALTMAKYVGDAALRVLVMQACRGCSFWDARKEAYAASRLVQAADAARTCRESAEYAAAAAWDLPAA